MNLLSCAQVLAVVGIALLAGIYLGHRAGPQFALQALDAPNFVRFQQVVHRHYVRFMPPLLLVSALSAALWLFLLRSQWQSATFWLVAVSFCGIVATAVMTRAVNVPLNNALMTWSPESPPADLREMWAPWDRVNTIRTIVSVGVLVLETVALTLAPSTI